VRVLAGRSGLVVGLIVAATVAFGLVGVPADRVQGDAQRIMYVHVPAAWLAYLAFFVTFLGSVGYLLRRDLRFDRLAAASAELGLLLTGAAIASGALWGKVTWGIWWDWDPRLTTTAVMFVVYAGYVLLRMSIVERVRRARLAAVLGIIGFANVPIVHFSVLWWRGLHQPPSVLADDRADPARDAARQRDRVHGRLCMAAPPSGRDRAWSRRGPGTPGVGEVTDAPFVIAAYVVVLGSLVAYAVSLRRRASSAAADDRAIKRRLDDG
jgi:heme exporter protein C